MKKRLIIAVLVILTLSGCSSYVYFGSIETRDSDGEMREHLIYWFRTERTLWFDEASGSIRLLTECSTRTMNFDETETGIIFRRSSEDKADSGEISINDACGRIIGYSRIEDIPEGLLELEVFCHPLPNEFSTAQRAYIMSGDTVYVFNVIRMDRDEFEGGAPKRTDCRTD
jgi:hypothetical protein